MAASKEKDNVFAEKALSFQIKESYKTARTNIDYSIIKKGCKKIAFTSSAKGDGKTITAINVALALAQKVNTKVLIVDCDLRRPRVHSALKLTPVPGIANHLNDECTYEDIIKPTNSPNLYAVCYGVIPPNPSELMSSKGMEEFIKRAENEFDYIIFDTPPVGVVIDAIPIINASDGTVIVVKNNSTTYPQLNSTIDTLKRSGCKILGVIVNKVKPEGLSKRKYYYKDYYYGD